MSWSISPGNGRGAAIGGYGWPSWSSACSGRLEATRSPAMSGTLQAHHGQIERLEEAGAVARGERPGSARHRACRSQIGHEVARGERHADRGFGERLAVRRNRHRAGPHAAMGERHVGGDDDAAGAGPLGDPVVGRVEAAATGLLATTTASSPCRSATRYASAFTGQASASTYRTMGFGSGSISIPCGAGTRPASILTRVVLYQGRRCDQEATCPGSGQVRPRSGVEIGPVPC